jgi:adenylate kinase family enzyme
VQVGTPKLVIFLDCPKVEMEKRLLKRGETSGRSDDNAATIIKRFETFQKESLPVVGFYDNFGHGLVLKVTILIASQKPKSIKFERSTTVNDKFSRTRETPKPALLISTMETFL